MKFREFWKKYKRDIMKLLTTHIALSVFGILCTVPMLLLEDAATVSLLCSAVSAFVFCFYYYLVRTQLWSLGAKDKLAADGGRMTLRPLTGLWLGLLASVPSFILNAGYIITTLYMDYAPIRAARTAFTYIEMLWDAPALGLLVATQNPFAYLASSILPALFAGLAYFLGTREFSLFGSKKKR